MWQNAKSFLITLLMKLEYVLYGRVYDQGRGAGWEFREGSGTIVNFNEQ